MDSNTIYQANLVKSKSRGLVLRASIESSKHLKDGTIKSKFIHSYNNLANDIVHKFESQQRSFEQSLRAIDNELRDLSEQSLYLLRTYKDPIMKGIGLAAGIAQAIGGGYGFVMSGFTSPYLALMFLHGLNNTYENGMYFITGKADVQGFMRLLYELPCKYAHIPDVYGSLAYGIADLLLSGIGLASLSKEVKTISTGIYAGFKEMRLFRAFDEQLLREYQAMSKPMLGFEILSDGVTTIGLIDEINKYDTEAPNTMDGALKKLIREQNRTR